MVRAYGLNAAGIKSHLSTAFFLAMKIDGNVPAQVREIMPKKSSDKSGDRPRCHSTSSERERGTLQKSIRMPRMGNNKAFCICNRGQPRRRKSERKASMTLDIIVGAFILCWLPFFTLALIRPLYKPDVLSHSVSSLFLFLGYCNSALNPILYAIFNKEIRKLYILIMCLRWRDVNELTREENYQ